jgi:hypothetical protein
VAGWALPRSCIYRCRSSHANGRGCARLLIRSRRDAGLVGASLSADVPLADSVEQVFSSCQVRFRTNFRLGDPPGAGCGHGGLSACGRSQGTGPCATTAGGVGVFRQWSERLESSHGFQLEAGGLGENRHDERCEVNPPAAPDRNLVLEWQSPSMAALRIAGRYVNQIVNVHHGGVTGAGPGCGTILRASKRRRCGRGDSKK